MCHNQNCIVAAYRNVGPDADILKHKHFCSGVVKIQTGYQDQMNANEVIACASLELGGQVNVNAERAVGRQLSIQERVQQSYKKQQAENDKMYINCDYIWEVLLWLNVCGPYVN